MALGRRFLDSGPTAGPNARILGRLSPRLCPMSVSLAKDKIKVLLLEGIHKTAVEAFEAARSR